MRIGSGGSRCPKRTRRRRRPERRHTRARRHRIRHLVHPRNNGGAIRSRRKQIRALIDLINGSRNRRHIGRPLDIHRIRRGSGANGARRKRRNLKELRLARAGRRTAHIESADGNGGSDKRRVVDRAQREGIGPCEGAVRTRGQHKVRRNQGGERHELMVTYIFRDTCWTRMEAVAPCGDERSPYNLLKNG